MNVDDAVVELAAVREEHGTTVMVLEPVVVLMELYRECVS